MTAMWESGEFSRRVADGSFKGIFPGDFIRKTKVIDGVTYTDHIDIIAELDPYYGKWNGIDEYIDTHHVGIIPYDRLGTSPMNETDDTTGGFKSSYMLNTTLPKYLGGYSNAYGSSHLLAFGHLISDGTNKDMISHGCSTWKGGSTDWSWDQTKITLMTEVQVYGSTVWSGGYDVGEGYKQLACFMLNQWLMLFKNATFWLRTVASAASFAIAGGSGDVTTSDAAHARFVRPLLLLY